MNDDLASAGVAVAVEEFIAVVAGDREPLLV